MILYMKKEKTPRLYRKHSFYHIYNRGNRKTRIYYNEKDYRVFVGLLYRYLKKSRLILIGYCLMPNHYHMILKSRKNLTEIPNFMHDFMTAYAMYFNRCHLKVGRIFQGPFQARRINGPIDLQTVKKYLMPNPFEAGLTEEKLGEDYKWLYIRP